MSDQPIVYLTGAHEFQYDVRRRATTTGDDEAAASLTVAGYFSATDGGSAIASTTTAMTERSATAGRYYGILAADTLDTALTAYANQTVWEVITIASEIETSEPVTVKATRRPS